MIKIDKRGKGNAGLIIFGILALLFISSVAVWIGLKIPSAQEQALGGTEESAKTIAAATNVGKASSVRFFAYDLEAASTSTPTSVPLYVQDDGGSMVVDGTVLGTTTRTVANTEIGKTLKFSAFNTSSYPSLVPYTSNGQVIDPMNYKVVGESPSVDVYTHAIATGMSIQLIDDTTFTTSDATGELNVTAAASTTSTDFSRVRIENNATDAAYQLGVIWLDTVVSTNVSSTDLIGTATVSGVANKASTQIVTSTLDAKARQRIQDQDDYIWEIDDDPVTAGNQPIMLHEADYINTGTLSVTLDGDGCTATVDDSLTLRIGDKSSFRSAKSASIVHNAFSNDADSPVDVGGADFVAPIAYCTP